MADDSKILADALREEAEALLTLREVARRTGTPYATIKRWVYTDRVLPIERVGPYQHPRVRVSVLIQFFGPSSRVA